MGIFGDALFSGPLFFALILVGNLGCTNVGDPFWDQILVPQDFVGNLRCANVGDPVMDQLLVVRDFVGVSGWKLRCANVFGNFPFFVDFGRWDDGGVKIIGNGGKLSASVCDWGSVSIDPGSLSKMVLPMPAQSRRECAATWWIRG